MIERQERNAARDAAQRILSLQEEEEKDAAFAKRIGVSPQHVGNWRAGKGADLDTVVKVHLSLGASLHWLALGQGAGDAYAAGLRSALEEIEAVEDRLRRLAGVKSRGGAAAIEDSRAAEKGADAARPKDPRRRRRSG